MVDARYWIWRACTSCELASSSVALTSASLSITEKSGVKSKIKPPPPPAFDVLDYKTFNDVALVSC